MNCLAKLTAASLWLLAAASQRAHAATAPNIVFFFTDDQDAFMGSVDYMPNVKKYIAEQGTTFAKHYCTVALCCPSRVNLWTGQMAHNTNVTSVEPPYGGYPKFIDGGYNDKHLALWMQQESNYTTYYAGKMFNAHSIHNYNKPPLSGYNHSQFFLEPFTYQYFNISLTKDGNPPHNPVGRYSTDLVTEYGLEYIDDALTNPDAPFFLTLAPVAPHAYLTHYPHSHVGPPQPAPRHRHLFPGYQIPRTDNFNPDEPSGVSWVAQLTKLTDDEVAKNDENQRKRLQALQAVDDMVGKVVEKLDAAGVLNNTYIFFTSDNGFHISQHRMQPGKMCGYETDVNVPFLVRGPNIPANYTRQDPSSHTDVAPTLLKIANNTVGGKDFDGAAMDLWNLPASGRTEHVAIEFWGFATEEGTGVVHRNNTYKALRIEADKYSFYYCVWCNNEKEMYDMKADPEQLHNLLAASAPKPTTALLFDQDTSGVSSRLDALMMVLKTCKGSTCTDPWLALHPGGSVQTLEGALAHGYDSFYQDQEQVSFSSCEDGYIISAEGPTSFKAFSEPGGDESAAARNGIVINPYWHWWE